MTYQNYESFGFEVEHSILCLGIVVDWLALFVQGLVVNYKHPGWLAVDEIQFCGTEIALRLLRLECLRYILLDFIVLVVIALAEGFRLTILKNNDDRTRSFFVKLVIWLLFVDWHERYCDVGTTTGKFNGYYCSIGHLKSLGNVQGYLRVNLCIEVEQTEVTRTESNSQNGWARAKTQCRNSTAIEEISCNSAPFLVVDE